MKNPTYLPKTLVKFEQIDNSIVIGIVDYCRFSTVRKEWLYHLAGWHDNFEEKCLKEYKN